MPLCFSYGANMDVAAMAQRCPKSKPLGPGRLVDHRFFIMREGYASLRRERGAIVHGLLWNLALSDVATLDRYEEVGRGLYRKVLHPIIHPDGVRRALVYLGRSVEPGEAKPGYLEPIVTAAGDLALPDRYVQELQRWLSGRSAVTHRRLR